MNPQAQRMMERLHLAAESGDDIDPELLLDAADYIFGLCNHIANIRAQIALLDQLDPTD